MTVSFSAGTANPGASGDVTAVNPVSATVKGDKNVNVRSSASTSSDVVEKVKGGTAITVTGQATGADSKVWYQVSFNWNGKDITGFIRSDYVTLSGDLTPATEQPGTEEPQQPAEPEVPEVTKAWETELYDGSWVLINTETSGSYKIEEMISASNTNAELYKTEVEKTTELTKSNKNQKIIIIILVILLVVAAAAATLIFLKLKDLMDEMEFSRTERETARRRSADRPQNGGRPAGTRQAVNGAQGAGRPAGARPAGAPGTRPAGNGAQGQNAGRPAGARPAGAPGARPAGNGAQGTGRPAGNGAQGQSAGRPAGARPAGNGAPGRDGNRRAERSQRETDAPVKQQHANEQTKPAGWKSKNFMADEDDFEFKFLDMDSEEDK